jgi:acetyl esterase/lipase
MHSFCKILLLLLLGISSSCAQQLIALYAGKAPGSESWNWTEQENKTNAFGTRVVYNVVDPSLTAYLPDPGKANGTAVIICPGGAFHTLSIDNEGIEVAKWLAARGVAGFVLKYRLVQSRTSDPVAELMPKMRDIKKLDVENAPVVPLAIADGRNAVAYVRAHAAQYQLNPDRIGIMGFSAGGTVAAGVGFSYTAASKPAFIAPIYPYIGAIENPNVRADAPPLFAAAATDDQHMYAKGGHGFGMRKQNLPVDSWIDRFGEWLDYLGFLTKAP